MIQLFYIPDRIKAIVEKVSDTCEESIGKTVHYKHGELDDVLTMLKQKDGSPMSPEKYPLLWLVTPFVASVDTNRGATSVDELRFILAYNTSKDMAIEDSDEAIIKPILLPVCAALVDGFGKEKGFMFSGNSKSVTKFDYSVHRRAKDAKENKPILYDYVDYLDIRIKEVSISNKIC